MTGRKPIAQFRWTQKQTLILSLACLLAGFGGGWLIHGPQKSSAATVASKVESAPAPQAQPAADTQAGNASQLKAMADSQAAPLLEQLKSQPSDSVLLTSVGNLYYDARQYPTAVEYYGRALAVDPRDVSVRTDMGTGYWYMGDADRAISEFNQALAYAPNNPNTLFNRGLVKWQGKKDAAAALADWQQLLATNPDYQARDQVEQMIAEVKAQGAAKR